MRVFIAGLWTETNSFSPLPTGLAAFEDGVLFHGDATKSPSVFQTAALHIWRDAAEKRGWEVSEGLLAAAQPGGITPRPVYETFREEILEQLRREPQADLVLLALHGAMIADGYDDCEGDLISRVRDILPDAQIGALLDPHCHLTQMMLENATALIAYKEYPHVDVPERAAELFELIAGAALGDTKPVMRDYDCKIVMAMPTPDGAMREWVDAMIEMEKMPKVLSLSLVHSFPWGDTARTGARSLAITDGDPLLASDLARQLGESLFAARHAIHQQVHSIPDALDLALVAPKGPVILPDMSDNAGGGAPSDATFLLREMLDRDMRSFATGIFWDPIAVRLLGDAGEGAVLSVRLGGKCGPMSGAPLDLSVKVRAIRQGLTQRYGVLPLDMGRCVWVSLEDKPDIDILISDQREQTFHPEAFEKMGMDLSKRDYVCVKSSNHWRAGFASIASAIVPVAGPGAITPDFANIAYSNRDGCYFPRIDDPFA